MSPPTSQTSSTFSINRIDTNTSGCSETPESCLQSCSYVQNTEDVDEIENEEVEKDEYTPIVTPDEAEPHKKWYHQLLMLKEQYWRGERGAFPPFPPPPLPSVMIAASLAWHINPFEELKNTKVKSFDQFLRQRYRRQYTHRFRPTDFQPLPPPHVFLGMIRTLAPHQYVDLTYALAGALLIGMGVGVPEFFPPLPPKMKPMSAFVEERDWDDGEDVDSSESSSDGEYSDDSECTKHVRKMKRVKTLKRREARRDRILLKSISSETETLKAQIFEKERNDAMEKDMNYKLLTLRRFIPRRMPPLFALHEMLYCQQLWLERRYFEKLHETLITPSDSSESSSPRKETNETTSLELKSSRRMGFNRVVTLEYKKPPNTPSTSSDEADDISIPL